MKTQKTATTSIALSGSVLLDAAVEFSACVDACRQIAEQAGMRVLLRSADELYYLEQSERPGLTAFNLLDGSDTIAVLDTRRKDRKPELLLNADQLIDRLRPDFILVSLCVAVMKAEKALKAN